MKHIKRSVLWVSKEPRAHSNPSRPQSIPFLVRPEPDR
jgi:hypothetical protein